MSWEGPGGSPGRRLTKRFVWDTTPLQRTRAHPVAGPPGQPRAGQPGNATPPGAVTASQGRKALGLASSPLPIGHSQLASQPQACWAGRTQQGPSIPPQAQPACRCVSSPLRRAWDLMRSQETLSEAAGSRLITEDASKPALPFESYEN